MPPENPSCQRIAVPVVVLVSLALHLLVLALPLALPTPREDTSADALTLVSLPPPQAETIKETPAPTIPAEPEETETSQPPLPSPQPLPESPRPPETTGEPHVPDATVLQRQTLSAARRIVRRENDDNSAAKPFARVPRLPSRPGALDAWLGTVTPRIDRSVRADGQTDARIVMADGQVICAHRRAARIEEVFNPWMSTAVAMMRDCGRERPDAASNGNDPWQRPLAGED